MILSMSKIVLPDAGYDWRCQRCHHQWRSRHPNEKPPVSCSKCRSAYWRTPKKARGEKQGKTKLDAITEALPDVLPLSPPPYLREAPVETEPWDMTSEEEVAAQQADAEAEEADADAAAHQEP